MDERAKQSAHISKKIKALRKSVYWSQSELARQIGITSAAISLIEKGNRIPSLDVCRKLADVFNISLAELTGDTNLSSDKINNEAQAFYRKYGDITKLTPAEQKILQDLIDRFKEKE